MSTHSYRQLDSIPDLEARAIVTELLHGVRAILGPHFTGMYLNGSLATGDFDAYSDIDFIIVTEGVLPDEAWPALQELHARLHASDSHWATHLEGTYYPRRSLRKYDPADARHPWLEHSQGYIELVDHDACRGTLQRWMTRERGIVLAGPAPDTLIDPILPREMVEAIQAVWVPWLPTLLADPAKLDNRWHQAYAVLCLCRMLYTIRHGTIVSKAAAARWAQASLDQRWSGVISRAQLDRYRPEIRVRQPVDPREVEPTLEFIRHFLEISGDNRPTLSVETLLGKIREKLKTNVRPFVVALDGQSGAGKSTLAARVAKECGGVVVQGDDFYVGSKDGSEQGWDTSSAKDKADLAIDWKRLRREALEPLLSGRIASYRPFDWLGWARAQQFDASKVEIGLGDTVITHNPAPLIVLDGVYSTRPELADLIDLKILVETPDELRRQRLIAREGQDFMKDWHQRWDMAEDYYFIHIRPRSSFDFIMPNA